jgi:ATP-binding cassette, subfamily B, bacterial PglK
MKKYFNEIILLLGKDKRKIPGMLFLFSLVSILDVAGIGIIGPYVAIVVDPINSINAIQEVIAWIELPNNSKDFLVLLSVVLLIIFLMKAVIGVWINYLIVKFSIDQQIRLRSELMHAYQSLPFVDYLKRNSSEYIHSTQTIVNHFSDGVVFVGMRAIADVIVAIVILSALAWTNFMAFSLIIGLIGFVLFFYNFLFSEKISKFGRRANFTATKMVQGINEGIEGIKEIRVLGKEQYFHRKVQDSSAEYGRNHVKSITISSAPRYLLELTLIVFLVSLVMLSLSTSGNLEDLLPTLAVFGFSAVRLLPAANTLANSIMQLKFNRNSVSRLYSDIKDSQSLTKKTPIEKSNHSDVFVNFSLQGVYYKYPEGSSDSLSNIDFSIKAGESVGIIGSSGSGKTTLVHILLALLEPKKGGRFLNGDILTEKDIKVWRSYIAYLPQQVFLIDNSLKLNVALGVNDADIDEEKVKVALNKAKLSELINELPNGIETMLGEGGVRLSGGQRQRVSLARAFYHERDILIMDESTSALDNETEREIINEIQRLKGSITLIVIAHRLTTVHHCDRIYRLEQGRVISVGSPDEVL